MNFGAIFERIDWRNLGTGAAIWLSGFLQAWFLAGDFDPLQSLEGVASAHGLFCDDQAASPGVLLKMAALTLGVDSSSGGASLLQFWCFASFATCFWVCYRLLLSGGLTGWWLWIHLGVIGGCMTGSLQSVDLGDPFLGNIALLGLCALFYLERRLPLFWVLFAVLVFHEPAFWFVIVGFALHQVSLPRVQMEFAGLLWTIPMFCGIPFALLNLWFFLVGGHPPGLGQTIDVAATPIHFWLDGELFAPVAVGFLTLSMLLFGGRWALLRQSGMLLWLLFSGGIWLLSFQGPMHPVLWAKWVVWMGCAGLFGSVLEMRGRYFRLGLLGMISLAAFVPDWKGGRMDRSEVTNLKVFATQSREFVKDAIDTDALRDGEVWMMAGLPVLWRDCSVKMIGRDEPVEEVLAMVKGGNPQLIMLPEHRAFQYGMQGLGYERKLDFWYPALNGDVPWAFWKISNGKPLMSQDLTDSSLCASQMHRVEGLDLRLYSMAGAFHLHIPDSGVAYFRTGIWAEESALRSVSVRVITDGRSAQAKPLEELIGSEFVLNGSIRTLKLEFENFSGSGRQLAFQNPSGAAILLVNPEIIRHSDK